MFPEQPSMRGPITARTRPPRALARAWACATLIASFGPGAAKATPAQELLGAYEAAVTYPESYAAYLEKQPEAIRDTAFQRCLRAAKNRLRRLEVPHSDVCGRYLKPGAQEQCIAEDLRIDTFGFLQSMEEALRTGTNWAETVHGSMTLEKKRALEAREGDGAYIGTATTTLERMRSVNRFYLRCDLTWSKTPGPTTRTRLRTPEAAPPRPKSTGTPARTASAQSPARIGEARRACLEEHRARWNRCPGRANAWSESRTQCLSRSSSLYAVCLEKQLPSYSPRVRGARCRERAFRERSPKMVAACDRAERAILRGQRARWPYGDLW